MPRTVSPLAAEVSGAMGAPTSRGMPSGPGGPANASVAEPPRPKARPTATLPNVETMIVSQKRRCRLVGLLVPARARLRYAPGRGVTVLDFVGRAGRLVTGLMASPPALQATRGPLAAP